MTFINKSIFMYFWQLIIATIPDEGKEKAPSILTEDNIKLLFEIQKKVSIRYL